MVKSVSLAIVGVVVLAVVGIIVFNSNKANAPTTNTSNNQLDSNGNAEPSTDVSRTFTTADVAKNNTKTACWTIIDGNIYDITSYIPRHPGGDEILRACGTDGSTLFNSRQTEEGESVGSGTEHSQSAKSNLSSFLIGTLAE